MDANDKLQIAAENCHYYAPDGSPRYSVIGKNGKERPTTIKDARENGWVPSVTLILSVADKPGLNIWKLKQLLEASLTLPRKEGESMDDFAARVITDSQEQSKKAAERGKALHAAIEKFIQSGITEGYGDFTPHVIKVRHVLMQLGIDISQGNAERSFASPLGYGGKIDYSNDDAVILDFKSKDRIEEKKQLAYDNHAMQLAAYGRGLAWQSPPTIFGTKVVFQGMKFRALNVFVGIEDVEVRTHEWTHEDLDDAWEKFLLLLKYWQLKNRFGKLVHKEGQVL